MLTIWSPAARSIDESAHVLTRYLTSLRASTGRAARMQRSVRFKGVHKSRSGHQPTMTLPIIYGTVCVDRPHRHGDGT